MPKVSVIVPVYNTEKYLRKCLDSIINQTLQDIEIICIDDCSPDNSRDILREYENRYSNLLRGIYLEKNVRQGGARNRGIKAAAGDYILFVDSDDYIEKNLCEKLYRSAVSNDADSVIYDYIVEEAGKSTYIPSLSHQIQNPYNIEKKILADETASCYAWNKLWKRELLVQLECAFPEGMVYEDIAVTYVWLFQAEKINYIGEGLYHYVSREDSSVHTSSVENWCQFVKAVISLIRNFVKFGLHKQYHNELTKLVLSLLSSFLTAVLNGTEIEKETVYPQLLDCMNQNLPDWEAVLEQDDLITPAQKYILTCFLRDGSFRYTLLEKAAIQYQGKNIAIWGTGIWGRRMTKLLKVHKLGYCLIDSNPARWGNYQDGLKIVPFGEVQNDCDVVIVAVKDAEAYEKIKQTVEDANPAVEVVHYEALFTNA